MSFLQLHTQISLVIMWPSHPPLQTRIGTLFADLFNILIEHKVAPVRDLSHCLDVRPRLAWPLGALLPWGETTKGQQLQSQALAPHFMGARKPGAKATKDRGDSVGMLQYQLSTTYTHLAHYLQVRIEPNYTSVMVAMMVIEGLGRSLDPTLDILRAARSCLLQAGKKSLRKLTYMTQELTNIQLYKLFIMLAIRTYQSAVYQLIIMLLCVYFYIPFNCFLIMTKVKYTALLVAK